MTWSSPPKLPIASKATDRQSQPVTWSSPQKLPIAPIASRPKLLKRYKNQCFCDLRLQKHSKRNGLSDLGRGATKNKKRTVTKLSSEPASDLVFTPKVTDRLQSYRSPEPASDLILTAKVTDRSHSPPPKVAQTV